MSQATHCLVTGSSGGGKSTLLREMHDTFSGISVFLTVKSNERKAAHEPPRRITESSCSYDGAIARTRQWAKERPERVQIIVDECQQSGLANGEGPLVDGLHEDREDNIKWVPCTQSPQSLSDGYTALQQCESIYWVGTAKTFHDGFFRYYSLQDIDFPQEPYSYVKIKPTKPPKVVGPAKTKEKYA